MPRNKVQKKKHSFEEKQAAKKINKYLEEEILADASNEFEKQNLFTSWLNNAKVLAEVVYYDRDLEGLLQRQNASGSCCPVK